jgi:protein-S-isoprenylcysteine O-methyltransferase Ste14
LLIAAGAFVVLDSFARFALQGLGTPAPVFPTRHLVVKGFYRFVRNPMYLAVVAVIVGQAVLFGDVRLLEYGLIAWLVAHLFVLGYEEHTLHRTFGAAYESFCANVPRWIPRLTRWRGGVSQTGGSEGRRRL